MYAFLSLLCSADCLTEATHRSFHWTGTLARTHVGESAAEVAEADRTGMTPAGRGDKFATGGCFGKADSAIPSVWDTRRKLSNAYDAMRRGVANSSQFADSRRKFSRCAEQAGVSGAGPGT